MTLILFLKKKLVLQENQDQKAKHLPNQHPPQNPDPTATANLPTAAPLPGGRSKVPSWAYYIADDKKVNGQLEKGAICQVNVGGRICAK